MKSAILIFLLHILTGVATSIHSFMPNDSIIDAVGGLRSVYKEIKLVLVVLLWYAVA